MDLIKSSNFKVLIVDDVEENLRVIGHVLGENKIAISVARNGKQAIKIALNKLPDLILLDIAMPEMDGHEVCQILKNNELTKEIPIIFLTALARAKDIVKGFELGAIDYITKPFNKNELLSRVFTHLYLKKSKDIIKEQTQILINQKHELEAQNDSLQIQKSKIEKQHNNIISSINYAQKIQNALLPSEAILKKNIPHNFILYLPKDIIGGDFYWFKQVHNFIFIAVADCTGHGVPGALMSMLGISLLNEILGSKNIFQTDKILNELRKQLIVSLHPGHSNRIIRDGLDIALCSINFNNNKLQYSGAFNPLIVIRKNKDTGKAELTEIKADRMPIGVGLEERPFTNTEMQLKANDLLYLFSDGYADQFGGDKGKKFFLANFKELLLNISDKPMPEQKNILLDTLFKWQKNFDQVDDILIVGIKIPEINKQ